MDFPTEIIKTVLCHLDDVKDLKQCLLVSPEIRDLIIKTPELMRKLHVYLMHDTWKTKLPFIDEYGFFIRSIKLDDIGFQSTKEYMDILRKVTNVEDLTICDCYLVKEREGDRDDDDEEDEENEGNQAHVDAPIIFENFEEIQPNENRNERNDNIDMAAPDMPNAEEDNERMIVDELNENRQNNEQMVVDQVNEIEDENSVNNNNNHNEIALNHEIQNNEENDNPVIEEAIQLNSNDDSNKENENENDALPLSLDKLTSLDLESSTISEVIVSSLPNCNKLKKLKLTFYYQEPILTFTEFLCRQDDLEELDLLGWSEMVFKCLFKDDIRDKIKFRLKKFSLECEMCYNLNFSNFFLSQSQYIQELELSSYNINFHYYRIIFNNFNNLKKLIIPIDWALNDLRVNSIKDCRIESLKELEMVGSNEDRTIFKTFINIFPNIETLKCENLLSFSLHGILENFKKLKCIKSDNLRLETLLFVKLPSLKSIETDYFYPITMDFIWQNIAKDCENLENIQIEDIGNCKLNESIKFEFETIIRNLKYFKKLKTCEIICTLQENTVNPDHDAGANQNANANFEVNPFYKMSIDVNDKKTKISEYFAQHCADLVQMLREIEIFKECDITED